MPPQASAQARLDFFFLAGISSRVSFVRLTRYTHTHLMSITLAYFYILSLMEYEEWRGLVHRTGRAGSVERGELICEGKRTLQVSER